MNKIYKLISATYTAGMLIAAPNVDAAPQVITGDTILNADGIAYGVEFDGDYILTVEDGQDIDWFINGNNPSLEYSVFINENNVSPTNSKGTINFKGDSTISRVVSGIYTYDNDFKFYSLKNINIGTIGQYSSVNFDDIVCVENINFQSDGEISLDYLIGGNITTDIDNTGTLTIRGEWNSLIEVPQGIGSPTNRLKKLNISGFAPFSGGDIYVNSLDFNGESSATFENHIYTSNIDMGLSTLTASGGLDLSGGSLQVAISGTQSGQIDASTSGFNLNTNTSVEVNVLTVPPTHNTQYAIAKSNEAINVPILPVIDNSAVWDFSLSGVGNDLILTALRIRTYGALSGWAKPAGTMLDTINTGGTVSGEMQDVFTALNYLSTDNEVDAAVTETAPNVSGGSIVGSINIANETLSTIDTRLAFSSPEPIRLASLSTDNLSGLSAGDTTIDYGIWTQLFGRKAEQDERDGVPGFDNELFGLVVGADKLLVDKFRLGVAYSYAISDVTGNDSQSGDTTDIDSHQLSVYSRYETGAWYLNGIAIAGLNNYETGRDISFMGTKAKGDFDGQQYTARVDGGYDYKLQNGLIISPQALLQYLSLKQDSYTESGADALNLHVNSETSEVLTSGLGFKFSGEIEKQDLKIKPEFSAMWLHDYKGDNVSTTTSFINDGGAFNTEGASVEKDSFRLGAGLVFEAANNIIVFLKYEGELKNDYDSHGGLVNLRYEF